MTAHARKRAFDLVETDQLSSSARKDNRRNMSASTEILNHVDLLGPHPDEVNLGPEFERADSPQRDQISLGPPLEKQDSHPFDPEVLDNIDLLGPQHEQINLEADFDKAESEPSPTPFDPQKLKERYEAERDIRLKHSKGIDQYQLVEVDGQFSQYLDDPWIKEDLSRDPVSETVEVLIIGGGYGAQLVAVRLLEAGVKSIRMLEKAGDFGGT